MKLPRQLARRASRPAQDQRPPSAAGEAAAPPSRPPQRREDVRAGGRTEVHVGRPGEPMLRCTSVDYSGSGLRAVLPGVSLDEGEQVDVFMRMRDGVMVEARAIVVRCEEQGVSAFHFLEIDPHQRELLIRHVFAEQRYGLASSRGRS